jgi:hypothetical protein
MDSLSSLAVGEPRLPPELGHKIFEIAALSRVTEIPNLLRVAQRVKKWWDPFEVHMHSIHVSQGGAIAVSCGLLQGLGAS